MITSSADILVWENRLLQALATADIPALDALLHDDLLFIIPTGDTITKQDDLANYRKQLLKVSRLDVESQQFSVVNSNAVTVSVVRMEGEFAGQAFGGRFKYIRTWQEGANGWQVIGGAGMALGE